MQLFLVKARHWSVPNALRSLHGSLDAAEAKAASLVDVLEADAQAEGLVKTATDPKAPWRDRLTILQADIAALCDTRPEIDVVGVLYELDDGGYNPVSQLIHAVTDAIDFEAEAFDHDGEINGGDLVDWWRETRLAFKAALARLQTPFSPSTCNVSS